MRTIKSKHKDVVFTHFGIIYTLSVHMATQETNRRGITSLKGRENGHTGLELGNIRRDQPITSSASEQEGGLSAEDQYMRLIRKFPLLSPGQEVELAMAREAGIGAKLQLAKLQEQSQNGSINQEELVKLQQRVEAGDAAFQKMVESNLRLVAAVARRYVGRANMQLLDLVQEGNVGLMDAIERFDYRRGNKLATYATWWIRQAITRAISDQGGTIRLPNHVREKIGVCDKAERILRTELGREPTDEELSQRVGMDLERMKQLKKLASRVSYVASLDAPISSGSEVRLCDAIPDRDNLLQDRIENDFRRKALFDVIAQLPPREQKVVQERFGLGKDGRVKTLEEIARMFGVTKERIRQLESNALRRMRDIEKLKELK